MGTFHGLEMARQALFAQQSALYTTGHNISNMNTEGYSRQRVNFETKTPFPGASRNRPEIPGQMGTGVQIGTVERLRNEFLDQQFRGENSKMGYYGERADAIGRMESLLNEPSESGLSRTMDQFRDALQDLSVNPKNSGSRAVVAERGQAVAESFNHLSKSLNSIRTDLKNEIEVTTIEANSLVNQIQNLNEQIQRVEPHGLLPNDLYDERDVLIDRLSEIMNIKVTYEKSSESSPDIADGLAVIELVNDSGGSLEVGGVYLLEKADEDEDKYEIKKNKIELIYNESTDENVTKIKVGGKEINPTNLPMGSLKGLIESYGYQNDAGSESKGLYPEMIAELDKMAYEFATTFNEIHKAGVSLEELNKKGEEKPGSSEIPFFKELEGDKDITAENIRVSSKILDNPSKIAASSNKNPAVGNNDTALELARLFAKPLDGEDGKSLKGLGGKSVNGFYESLIGKLGVDGQEAQRMATNTAVLGAQVERERMAMSSVSLDEEMSNMIQFQHAYNAAARSMTSMDEMLDRIINNMGLVGR